jgi:hypothetical protein
MHSLLVAAGLAVVMLMPRMSGGVGKEFESTAEPKPKATMKASESTPGPRPTTYEGSGPPPKVGVAEETATGETWGDRSYVIPLLEVVTFEATLNLFDRTFVEEGVAAYGACTGVIFLNASVGISASVIGGTTRTSKSRFGRIAYVVTTILKVLSSRPRYLLVEVDGKAHPYRAVEVAIMNCGLLSRMFYPKGSDIRIDDGHLNQRRGQSRSLSISYSRRRCLRSSKRSPCYLPFCCRSCSFCSFRLPSIR